MVRRERVSKKNTEDYITTKGEGEIPCFLVFSDPRHVDYIDDLLQQIERTLNENRCKTYQLRKEIKSTEDYLNKLEQIIKNCALGIILLDGFRSNVVFEFGYLKGKGKPIILLQSSDANVNINNLYKSLKDSGLSQKDFNKLMPPKLDIDFHLSDLAGKHVIKFKRIDVFNKATDLSSKLLADLHKKQNEIIEELFNITIKNHENQSDKFEPQISLKTKALFESYTNIEKFTLSDIKKIHADMENILRLGNTSLQLRIYRLLVEAYLSKTTQTEPAKSSENAHCLSIAIELFRIILKISHKSNNPNIHDMQRKMGEAYFQLSQYENKPKNYKNAIKALEAAFQGYKTNHNRTNSAIVLNSLGLVYRMLAEVENKTKNCNFAIDNFKNALKYCSIQDSPNKYSEICNNMGIAYTMLAEGENKAEYRKQAIEAHKKAVKGFNLEKELDPIGYAFAQNYLGTAYRMFAKKKNKAYYCGEAIKAHKEAIERFKCHDRIGYASALNYLGTAYRMLAEGKIDIANNYENAMNAYKEALTVYNEHDQNYAMTQADLGWVYMMIDEMNNNMVNCNSAIAAYQTALDVYTSEDFPLDYIKINYLLGDAYSTLAEAKDKNVNYKLAIEAYNKAKDLLLVKRKKIPEDLKKNCLDIEEKIQKCKRAIAPA